MTSFRLNAGRPATYLGGGSSARKIEEAVDVKPLDPFYPNRIPDTLLKCGCKIPWPIVTLIGSGRGTSGRQVHCDLHGWQHVADKEIARAKKGMKQCRSTPNQSTLPDTPPF